MICDCIAADYLGGYPFSFKEGASPLLYLCFMTLRAIMWSNPASFQMRQVVPRRKPNLYQIQLQNKTFISNAFAYFLVHGINVTVNSNAHCWHSVINLHAWCILHHMQEINICLYSKDKVLLFRAYLLFVAQRTLSLFKFEYNDQSD